MVTTLLKLIYTVIFALGLLLPSVSLAQDETPRPSTPHAPIPYADQWLSIQPGGFHWYAFKYHEAEENRPLEISLYTRMNGGVRLLLLNGDQVRVWQQGGKLEHFGEATPVYRRVEEPVSKDEYCREKPDADICVDPDDDGGGVPCPNEDQGDSDDCYLLEVPEPRGFSRWAGKIGASGHFYMLVRHDSRAVEPAEYRVMIDGDGATFR